MADSTANTILPLQTASLEPCEETKNKLLTIDRQYIQNTWPATCSHGGVRDAHWDMWLHILWKYKAFIDFKCWEGSRKIILLLEFFQILRYSSKRFLSMFHPHYEESFLIPYLTTSCWGVALSLGFFRDGEQLVPVLCIITPHEFEASHSNYLRDK